MGDYADDPQFIAWRERCERELVPKLQDSGAVVSLVPEGETDVKFAVELGLSIMMDKPIIAVVTPETKVPDKLVKVADHIIEGDMKTVAGQDRLRTRLTELLETL